MRGYARLTTAPTAAARGRAAAAAAAARTATAASRRRADDLTAAAPAPTTSASRRRHVAAAAGASSPSSNDPSSPTPKMTADERAAVRAGVDAAAATIGEIIEEVSRDVFVSEAAAYVSGAPPDVALADAVRGAVAARLEWLDANFLGALGGYIEVARARGGDPSLLELLTLVRTEVLEQVARRLPPPVRVLNAALAHASARARVGVLRSALAGGGGDVPACDMEALAAAAGQLVDDMEDQTEVADRALLARLVLVREELRALHWRATRGVALGGAAGNGQGDGDDSLTFTGGSAGSAAAAEGPSPQQQQQPSQQRDSVEAIAADAAAAAADAAASDGGFFSFHRGNLPRRCAAFAQALLAVPEPPRRVALLRKAFAEDWDGMAAPAAPPSSVATGTNAAGGDVTSGDSVAEAPDVVRPGRLLSTVHAMRRELALQHSAGGSSGGSGSGSGSGAANVDAVLERLSAISVEATLVLDEMSRAAGAGPPQPQRGSAGAGAAACK